MPFQYEGYRSPFANSIAELMLRRGEIAARAAEQSGNAWADTSCQANETLVKEQASAKEKKAGLWQNPDPIKPADFRKMKAQQPEVAQGPVRRLYTGLAPIQQPRSPKLALGMSLEDFIAYCGDKGTRSKVSSNEYSQHFSLNYPTIDENVRKNCDGDFDFRRRAGEALFTLESVLQ